MMKNANDVVHKHSKLRTRVSELESELENSKNHNTIIKVELEKYRQKAEELAQLVRTRYEQIQILEEQLNKKISEQSDFKAERIRMAEKLDKYIEKIDEIIA
jgi:uncharacterized coiled-coil DUF342 family protein